MELLKSLGIDSTLWIHLACFIVAYVALGQLVFKPYLQAFQERERRTIGNEESAARLIAEAHELSADYDKQAKAIDAKIKSIYDSSRLEATREFERSMQSGREEAGAEMSAARSRIGTELQAARAALLADVPGISSAIATKLAGKELH